MKKTFKKTIRQSIIWGDKELLEFKPNIGRMWTMRIFLKSNYICFNIDYTNNSQGILMKLIW